MEDSEPKSSDQNQLREAGKGSTGLDDLFDKWEQEAVYRASLPTWRRIIHDTPRAITVVLPRIARAFPHRIRTRINRMHRGWSDIDWWDYAAQNSRRAVILLTEMRDKGHGISVPGENPSIQGVSLDGAGREEWKAMLDDMIFFHQCIAGQYKEDHGKFGILPSENYHEIKSPDAKRRYARGKYLYFKMYESLWD